MPRNTAARSEVLPVSDSLRGQRIVLVGLMGAGKTSIGRRLAARLGLPFLDADAEIELAAGCSIPELFARYGEGYFRDGEKKVIRRLLAGGRASSCCRRSPRPPLLRRVASRENRPLLANQDHAATLSRLMAQRYPIY